MTTPPEPPTPPTPPTPIAPGFDPRWSDVPDFVLGITHEIWEGRDIAALRRHYAPDLIVRAPASVMTGAEAIVAATLATLAEFPDRALPGEDVIWCWADAARTGFLSSHRLLCTATHAGPGVYGAPTGRRLTYRILADCFCAGNAVCDEWLVRDQSAIVAQMGADVVDWTRGLVAREGGPEACARPFVPALDRAGPYCGAGDDDPWGEDLAGILGAIMDADLGVIPRAYDRAAELHYPGHRTGHGHAAADAFWLGLRAAFPSAAFRVHTRIGRAEAGTSPRAAVRWSLDGRHDGWGPFGAPSGAPVHVMGITHAEFGPRGLRREWTLIDETAIWKQILLATGDL